MNKYIKGTDTEICLWESPTIGIDEMRGYVRSGDLEEIKKLCLARKKGLENWKNESECQFYSKCSR